MDHNERIIEILLRKTVDLDKPENNTQSDLYFKERSYKKWAVEKMLNLCMERIAEPTDVEEIITEFIYKMIVFSFISNTWDGMFCFSTAAKIGERILTEANTEIRKEQKGEIT